MANKLVLNLSGGMNRKTSPFIIRDDECELAVNYHLDKVGALTKRGGYSQFATQPNSGKTILGLFNFYDTLGTHQLMVQNNAGDTNAVIYYLNGSNQWTASDKTDETAGAKARFAVFVGYAFRVNGQDDVATSDDGQTWGTTNAITSVQATYVAVFKDRVYVANGQTSTFRSRLWFSSLPTAGAITWDKTNDWIDINPDDGDEITALENNGNKLLIFKNRALYRWDFGQVEPDRLIGVGTSSQESVKTNFDVGITFFANPYGVFAYSGGRPRLLSRKIQDIIDAVSDWTEVYAEIDNDHYYLSVGDITVDGETINNAVLVYHISLDAWTIYSFAEEVKYFARLTPDNELNPSLYFGSTDGKTYKMDGGTDDDGVEIGTKFVSKEYLLSYPIMTTLTRCDVFSEVFGTTQVYVDVDRRDQPIPLGQITDRVTSLSPRDVRRLNSLQVIMSDYSTNDSIIDGYNIEHEAETRKQEEVMKRRKYGNP